MKLFCIKKMDTDLLTEKAYRVLIGRSGEVSDFLRAEIGAAASRYPNEDSYLGAMHHFVSAIGDAPEDYLERWNLIEEIDTHEFGSQAHTLADEILAVIKLPLSKRGPVE